MTKEEELEKLSIEIKKAQDKLGDIDNAINRESLVIESKTKESSEILSKTEQLKDDLIVLQENYAEEKQGLKVFKEDSKEKKDKLNEEIKKLEIELTSISSGLTSNITSLKASKTGLIEQIDTLYISLKKEIDIKEKAISELDKKIEVKTYALQNLESEFKAKSGNYKTLIASLNDEYDIKSNLIKELTSSIESFTKKIESKEKELYKISGEILESGEEYSDLEVKIAELITIKDSLQVEIDTFEKEKAQFVSDKFALQKNKDDMDRREEFIKEKYNQAGVRYN